jgi:hypothetical protein
MKTLTSALVGLYVISGLFPGHPLTQAARSGRNSQHWVVSLNSQTCPGAQFTRIQDAIDASSPHDTIHICNGVYQEQLKITKYLDIDGDAEVYLSPSSIVPNTTDSATGDPTAAAILVTGAELVNLYGFTVDLANNGIAGCSPRLAGILYQNASGRVDTMRVHNVKLSTEFKGCQSGTAILAESSSGGRTSIEIQKCVIKGYQKNGITAVKSGTSAAIHDNIVTGFGPTTGAAQNGIRIGLGAKGSIYKNIVAGNLWSPCQTVNTCRSRGTDILVEQSDDVLVAGNQVLLSQVGILVHGKNNKVALNSAYIIKAFNGIRIQGNYNTVSKNEIGDSEESDIFLDGIENSVTLNKLSNAPVGIMKTSTSTKNLIKENSFNNVAVDVKDSANASSKGQIVREHQSRGGSLNL